ncbi:uncharacterized protein FPRO_00497 [Fusarium proliferatum ET1]|uniref:Uncharacterized protein n=1 Tax=Fusarium proliferatum (strain ET1) TaxID=1227346 RepID=A0A1L7V7Z6_FUSPR|nr:uncharacterized protein FPRO_00497 [Fusarium proliferatum ET1]CZR35380.1 uncharacterized protein FPRO_00497 [Fusarium proliferatum ET1]
MFFPGAMPATFFCFLQGVSIELIKPVLGCNSMKRRSLQLADLHGPFYDSPFKSPLPLSTQGSLWSSAQPGSAFYAGAEHSVWRRPAWGMETRR